MVGSYIVVKRTPQSTKYKSAVYRLHQLSAAVARLEQLTEITSKLCAPNTSPQRIGPQRRSSPPTRLAAPQARERSFLEWTGQIVWEGYWGGIAVSVSTDHWPPLEQCCILIHNSANFSILIPMFWMQIKLQHNIVASKIIWRLNLTMQIVCKRATVYNLNSLVIQFRETQRLNHYSTYFIRVKNVLFIFILIQYVT